uniref:Uncharacterized protein n=1 Tax=Aegilops tauschii subsp. strangulata TaxID=200361 RepID=A0A453MLS1_AEGTS
PFVSAFFETNVGLDYESIAKFWVANGKHSALNTVNAAVLWCLWKYRNSIIFN